VTDKPIWFPHMVCGEGNNHVSVGKENYFLSGDGYLMPTKKAAAARLALFQEVRSVGSCA
jgi:hypothetical protein